MEEDVSTLAPRPRRQLPSPVRPAHDVTNPRRTLLGFVATRRVVEIMLTVILGVGGCLLIFGANFGLHMVKTQLNAQAISFPAKGSPA